MYVVTYVYMYASGLKPGQHHWIRWPIDLDSNPAQTQTWPGSIKVEAGAETYILGVTNWLCVLYSKDSL